jgi:hypothetical protein
VLDDLTGPAFVLAATLPDGDAIAIRERPQIFTGKPLDARQPLAPIKSLCSDEETHFRERMFRAKPAFLLRRREDKVIK